MTNYRVTVTVEVADVDEQTPQQAIDWVKSTIRDVIDTAVFTQESTVDEQEATK